MVSTRAGEHANGEAVANGKAQETAEAAAGEKRVIDQDTAEDAPDAKRAKKSDDGARQTTIEEALEKQDDAESKKPETKQENADTSDTEMKDRDENVAEDAKEVAETQAAKDVEEAAKESKAEESKPEEEKNTEDNKEAVPANDSKVEAKNETKEKDEVAGSKNKEETTEETKADEKPATKESNGDTAEIPHADNKVPSNVLEKGIICFFIRARVNLDEAEEVDDIARSYLILRPIAPDSKLGDGPIGDAGNTRLIALPKKVFPESGRDRFMMFVEKAGASFAELKEQFLSGDQNETKAGTSQVPAATPVGEGVYVITTTGRESHLAYMLTLPSNIGEVQEELGLKEQGSFILSTKNPNKSGPANASLPENPDYPEKINKEFRDLRWMPTKPEHLDYANAQILLIGESSGIKKATEPRKKDVKEGNEEPEKILEQIEDEDTKRMENLAEDDSGAIFADLQARAKDYPKLQTTF
ncbi:hypothetical protein CGLO_06100 [Colletotrichum gloeosporioides Cg-14]|uniref:BTB domain transcription factor n=1 Tax=Colletotrichum gloeosporioides (strain Cg-14) TaxID=1237896 RepID=T0KQ35_COLGC|nr:hypothetical protein CGLO_06100 [Colletotrichum gloeosporioides Cg-14]